MNRAGKRAMEKVELEGERNLPGILFERMAVMLVAPFGKIRKAGPRRGRSGWKNGKSSQGLYLHLRRLLEMELMKEEGVEI